ncbi:DnaJ C-terminal domain-containing protein [Paramagnetospirillum magneticum]|uniref:DnaJ-class molecular chaperone n=1 Tax=Paramagnetospirillum magneticum (strain ATCC 700264 / AMB-1) TaxID=342108 RepID=Q2W8Y3_PARM1|nr:DnaJ C-terminal domain-containing protein [Paramagnetospirillum magneticum]BAE49692.1 DnaJ-class molecular chaperone [Paramagnetospirillum magneticum AMB-1]
MKDPYLVLGVARTASDDDIKKAYRALARELHPDLNPGDAKAESRFKDISAAYDFLSDSTKRAQFDAGEIDATGSPKRGAWRSRPGARPGPGGGGPRGGFGGFGENVDDIMAELFRRKQKAQSQAHAKARPRGGDVRHTLTISFLDAAAGGTKRVTLMSGRTVEVRIPPGSQDGQTLRLKGQGHGADDGAVPGDAFIEIKVEDHSHFKRRDLDVLLDLPVTVQEAVLGGKVPVPTIDGKVMVTIPPGSNTGAVLRLKGRGIAGPGNTRGDQLVTLTVVLPEDGEFRQLVEKWGPRHGYDPRAKAGLT